MANKYEFNIEDINKVVIITETDPQKFTITCNRKMDEDGNPTIYFVETYSAEPEEDEASTTIICHRCGTWLTFPKDWKEEFYCSDCKENYENTYDEEFLASFILSYMNEESFKNITMIINDTVIK